MLCPRRRSTSLADALRLFVGAEVRLRLRQGSTATVLGLALPSGCSAYDGEFVPLAQGVGVPPVTADRKVLAAFPGVAVSPAGFLAPDRVTPAGAPAPP